MTEPFVGQVRPHPHDSHLFEVWIGAEWLTLAPNPNPGYVAPAYEVEALYDRLESTEAEVARLRAEPVLAPNALDASAERWQLYAAKLEIKLGELRGERDRLRAALKRSVAEAELRWSGKSMSDAELDEFADHVAHNPEVP